MALKLDADHAFFSNFLPSPYDGLRANERVLIDEDEIVNELRAIFRRYPSPVRRKLTPPMLVKMKMAKNCCDTHFSQIRFDGDGNISSCSMMLLDMTGHGNYKEADVWNNDFFKEMRKAFLSQDGEKLPEPCKVCPDNKGVSIA